MTPFSFCMSCRLTSTFQSTLRVPLGGFASLSTFLKGSKGSVLGSRSRPFLTPKFQSRGNAQIQRSGKMSYFVIGVSGVTCGGKTTLTKLLQRTFPWCRIIHQDHYFLADNHPVHARVPELNNTVNYEILESMDMAQMYKDVETILAGPGEFFDGRKGGVKSLQDPSLPANSKPEDAPNFDSGLELLKTVGSLDFDSSKFSHIPILIIEGFIIFESQFLFDKCDVRLFVTLDEEECRRRRLTRVYNPPDCPGYFDKIVWPEYVKHFRKYVEKRPGLKVFDGKEDVQRIWKDCVQIVECRLQEKYFRSQDVPHQVQANGATKKNSTIITNAL